MKNTIIDSFLFFILPGLAYSIAYDLSILDRDIYQALIIALATSGVAYVAAFALVGGYNSISAGRRFEILKPTFIFSTTYWLVLVLSNIADGYGEGNVLVFLFGTAVALGIALRRINVECVYNRELENIELAVDQPPLIERSPWFFFLYWKVRDNFSEYWVIYGFIGFCIWVFLRK